MAAGNFRTPVTGIQYATVAASQTNQALTPQGSGGAGALGDFLLQLLIIPATTSPGAVSITDDGGSPITIFPGGATSVVDLKPFWVPINAISTSGAWKVTTGANVSVLATGQFS